MNRMRNLLSGKFVAALFWAGLMVPAPGLAAELSVEVVGADSDKGQIHVGLYNDPATFPDREGRIGGREKTIEKGRAMVVFKGLPPGFYAVAVFHDENGNGAFDHRILKA